jgi:alpha-L-arabinofuranosidase
VMSPYPQLIPRPAAYVLQLFNQHFAPGRVESEVEDAPLLTGSLPALEVMASTTEASERLTLLAINKETTATITATIVISGFTPASTAQVWTLNGADISSFNDASHPTDVVTTESVVTDAGERFVYSFPAHSVTLIELLPAESGSRLYLPLVLRDYTPAIPTLSAQKNAGVNGDGTPAFAV